MPKQQTSKTTKIIGTNVQPINQLSNLTTIQAQLVDPDFLSASNNISATLSPHLGVFETQENDNAASQSLALAVNEPLEPRLSFLKVFKNISGLAIPMGLSFTFSFEVFFCVLLLHYLSQSEDDIAAATLASVLMNTICLMSMSPLFAIGIHLSGKLGEWREINKDKNYSPTLLAEKKEIIASTNANSLLIATLASAPAFLALYYSKSWLVSVFDQNIIVSQTAQNFLRTYAFAIPGLSFRLSLEQIMFSFGKTKPAMFMGLTSFAIGGLIASLLGFGLKLHLGLLLFEIPKLGAPGIALGFVIESYLTALSYGLYVGLSTDCREFGFFKHMFRRIRNNGTQLKNILKISGAVTFTTAIELAMTLAVGVLSGIVGVEGQDAMTFSMQFIFFEFVMLASFSLSCAQELSRELGARKYFDVNKIAKYGLLTTLIYLTPLPVIFAADPKILELLSGGATADVAATLKTLVPIMAAGFISDSVRYNLLHQLRALGDLVVPNLIAIFGMSTGICLAAGLGLKTSLGVNGVAIGYASGITLTAAGLLLRWNNQLERLNKTQLTQQEKEGGTFRSFRKLRASFFQPADSQPATEPAQSSETTRLLPEDKPLPYLVNSLTWSIPNLGNI